jgi:glutaredoxin
MVLCWLALPIFALLGIFSVKYRRLTIESLECLFKTLSLQKCKSGLDDRIRSDITGKLMKRSPLLAKIFYKNYKIIAIIILILFIWSAYISADGIYNYINYGNCNGPEETGFCIFDPTNSHSKVSEIEGIDVVSQSNFISPQLESNDPILGNPSAELTIIEFGCYACPYTKKAEPIVKEILEDYKGRVNFQVKSFIIPTHQWSFEAALAASCAQEQNKYEDYHNFLFENQEKLDYSILFQGARDLNLNMQEFELCLRNEKYKEEVNSDTLTGIQAGVIGTPTFFIGDDVIVGPKPIRTFKKIINKALE